MVKNKKGQLGHALTWIYKFVILVVVVGGIVAIVLGHYSQSFDIRDAESAVLAEKLVRCIAPEGIVKEFSNNSIRNCFPIDEQELFLNISLNGESIEIGNSFLAILCQAAEENVKIKKPPACHDSSYIVLNNNNLNKLGVFIAVRKTIKNI